MSEKPLTENLNQISLELQGESLMLQFGNSIASAVSVALNEKRSAAQSLLIALSGDLGAGKTTISRGILNGLGHSGSVKSPSYTLVEPYELPLGRVCHFDFYRLIDPEELEYMGFADYLLDAAICLIEWPERGEGFLPAADVSISIGDSKVGRCVTLHAHSQVGQQLVHQLAISGV